MLASADGFVDREQERVDIRMVLDRAATGNGSFAFLTGAPGIGATRLAPRSLRSMLARLAAGD